MAQTHFLDVDFDLKDIKTLDASSPYLVLYPLLLTCNFRIYITPFLFRTFRKCYKKVY